jgi:hypothetical protein
MIMKSTTLACHGLRTLATPARRVAASAPSIEAYRQDNPKVAAPLASATIV